MLVSSLKLTQKVDIIKLELEKEMGRKQPLKLNIGCMNGLTSFYRRFVRDFSTLAAPLNEIVKKFVVFEWGDQQKKAFIALKES